MSLILHGAHAISIAKSKIKCAESISAMMMQTGEGRGMEKSFTIFQGNLFFC